MYSFDLFNFFFYLPIPHNIDSIGCEIKDPSSGFLMGLYIVLDKLRIFYFFNLEMFWHQILS